MDNAAEAIMAVSFFGAFAVSVRAIAGVWMKRLETRSGAPSMAAIDEKLAHIDAAVDVIALEVERISEAQRFTARLMAERDSGQLAPPARAAEARVVTPH